VKRRLLTSAEHFATSFANFSIGLVLLGMLMDPKLIECTLFHLLFLLFSLWQMISDNNGFTGSVERIIWLCKHKFAVAYISSIEVGSCSRHACNGSTEGPLQLGIHEINDNIDMGNTYQGDVLLSAGIWMFRTLVSICLCLGVYAFAMTFSFLSYVSANNAP
jgi:hypothetical protein